MKFSLLKNPSVDRTRQQNCWIEHKKKYLTFLEYFQAIFCFKNAKEHALAKLESEIAAWYVPKGRSMNFNPPKKSCQWPYLITSSLPPPTLPHSMTSLLPSNNSSFNTPHSTQTYYEMNIQVLQPSSYWGWPQSYFTSVGSEKLLAMCFESLGLSNNIMGALSKRVLVVQEARKKQVYSSRQQQLLSKSHLVHKVLGPSKCLSKTSSWCRDTNRLPFAINNSNGIVIQVIDTLKRGHHCLFWKINEKRLRVQDVVNVTDPL